MALAGTGIQGISAKAPYKQGDLRTKADHTEFEGREGSNMKRVGLWAVGIGVLVSGGLITVAHAGANDGAPKCTLATLKGRYLFAAPTTLFPPALGLTEQAVGNAAGYHVFNGDGTGQDYVTVTINGVDQHLPSPFNLTYTLNSDCTGTYSVLPLGQGLPTFDIFVSPTGDEITSINTDPGNASSYTPSRRVWPPNRNAQ
jgi:hypothetical protein